MNYRKIRNLLLVLVALSLLLMSFVVMMIRMPGKSFEGPLPPLSEAHTQITEELGFDIQKLAGEIGERNLMQYDEFVAAAHYIESELSQFGYRVQRQSFEVSGKECYNLEVEISGDGRPEEIVVIGAHYDSVIGCPGANDNASGVAALLALARALADKKVSRTLRFVAFANEEPPHFMSNEMGSLIYAKQCRQTGENIVAMLSLETIGFYSDAPGSQHYPFPVGFFYPAKGNFIAFVGNYSSRGLVREAISTFRKHTEFPSEGGALPGIIPGVGWSDHWSFWKMGYSAIMVTDTAPFRYPYYHTAQDTPDKVHFEKLARVMVGLREVVLELASRD